MVARPIFTLLDRLHVLPIRLRAFARRGSPDALVFRDATIHFDYGVIDTPQPSEMVAGGASGWPRRFKIWKTSVAACVSVLAIPRATRNRVSISSIVARQNCPLASVSG